jgi:hypothetical protein
MLSQLGILIRTPATGARSVVRSDRISLSKRLKRMGDPLAQSGGGVLA